MTLHPTFCVLIKSWNDKIIVFYKMWDLVHKTKTVRDNSKCIPPHPPTHKSMPTIQNLIYAQIKQATDLRQMKIAVQNRKHGRSTALKKEWSWGLIWRSPEKVSVRGKFSVWERCSVWKEESLRTWWIVSRGKQFPVQALAGSGWPHRVLSVQWTKPYLPTTHVQLSVTVYSYYL